MAIDSILFDLDGTLVDSHPGILRSLQQAVGELLPEREVTIPKELIGPPVRKIYGTLFGDLNEETIAKLEKRFRDIYDNSGACLETHPFATVPETLKALNEKGISCYILTNKPMRPTQQILDHLKLTQYFKAIITPDVTEIRFKSKDETARYANEKYGFVQERTLVVGDSMDDAEAAQACGFHFYPVKYGYGLAHQVHDHALNSLSDLLSRL